MIILIKYLFKLDSVEYVFCWFPFLLLFSGNLASNMFVDGKMHIDLHNLGNVNHSV